MERLEVAAEAGIESDLAAAVEDLQGSDPVVDEVVETTKRTSKRMKMVQQTLHLLEEEDLVVDPECLTDLEEDLLVEVDVVEVVVPYDVVELHDPTPIGTMD